MTVCLEFKRTLRLYYDAYGPFYEDLKTNNRGVKRLTIQITR